MTRYSSSVKNSSGACVVATGTWLLQAAFLTRCTGESQIDTLLDPFPLPFGFGGILEIVESRQNVAEVLCDDCQEEKCHDKGSFMKHAAIGMLNMSDC